MLDYIELPLEHVCLLLSLKGASDGGLDIPHGVSRFAGFKGEELNSKKLRSYLFGGHVADYMKKLETSNNAKFQKQFSLFIKNKIGWKDIEGVYSKVHKAIRLNPDRKKKDKKPFDKTQQKRFRPKRRSLRQRKARVAQIKANAAKQK